MFIGALIDCINTNNVTDDKILEDIKYIRNTLYNGRLPETEEATKQWIVLPLLRSLGYNIFSSDVIPEYVADFGVKNDKHTDYLVNTLDNECIIIECKSTTTELNDKHINQLFRYYTSLVSEGKKIKVAILTNGIEYWFFKDTKTNNIMDSKPIHTLKIKKYSDNELLYFLNIKKYNCCEYEEITKNKLLRIIDNLMSYRYEVSCSKRKKGLEELDTIKQLIEYATEQDICKSIDSYKYALSDALDTLGVSIRDKEILLCAI